jgi:hypothetical protein
MLCHARSYEYGGRGHGYTLEWSISPLVLERLLVHKSKAILLALQSAGVGCLLLSQEQSLGDKQDGQRCDETQAGKVLPYILGDK